MDQLKRTSSNEHLGAAFPVVREETESKTQEVRPRETSVESGGYSTGETAADMLYNAFWGTRLWVASTWRDWGKDPVRDRRRDVEDASKSNPQKFAALIKKIEVGCSKEGETAALLFDYFGEGKPLEAYLLPTGVAVGDLMQAVENPTFPHNVVLLGILKNAAYSYSDIVRDAITPLMSDKSVSLQRKVIELQLLASLEDRDECSSTVLMAFILCFDQLSVGEQEGLLDGHYEDLEGTPLEELRRSDKIDYIRDTILVDFIEEAAHDAMDFARIESMQFYADRNQPFTVSSLYKQLSAKTKEALAVYETTAQRREERDRRPVPGKDGFSYFERDPTGEFAEEALNAYTAAIKVVLTESGVTLLET